MEGGTPPTPARHRRIGEQRERVEGVLYGEIEAPPLACSRAATAAVVTSTVLIIVSDSIYAVMFNILGW